MDRQQFSICFQFPHGQGEPTPDIPGIFNIYLVKKQPRKFQDFYQGIKTLVHPTIP
jgi:hypothetical protein